MANSPRLETVSRTATSRVTSLWPRTHLRIAMYPRCIQVSGSRISPSAPAPSGRSPGRRRYAPRTGTAVRATRRDAISANVTVRAKGRKKAPTSPWMNASGTKTTTVVMVEAKIAGPTSVVASSAARHLSRPAWMWRYTFSSTTMESSTTRPTDMANPPRVMKLRVMSCHDIRRMPVKTLRGIERAITTVGRRVLKKPLTIVGRMVSMKAKTTDTANRNPNIASLTRVSICRWMSGP